jgi:hypothetical protein
MIRLTKTFEMFDVDSDNFKKEMKACPIGYKDLPSLYEEDRSECYSKITDCGVYREDIAIYKILDKIYRFP